MKKIEITLYEYADLSAKAKEKALSKWRETNDDPMMQSHMINLLKEELDKAGIKYNEDSIDVRYSLSSCQGDGFMFEGLLYWGKYSVRIKHSGRYYHSYSKEVEMWETEKDNLNHSDNIIPESDQTEFETLYQLICKKMEQTGYDEIEYTNSEESFINVCDANEYTFEADGTMRNE